MSASSPPNVAELLDAGNRWKRQGRYREALAPLTEATRWAPDQAAAWLNRGVAHLELAQRDEAVACFRRALRLEPFRAEAHNILGAALLEQNRCGPAAAHLREALRLRPGYAAACDNLARVLKAQGRSSEAVKWHRQALAGAPSASTHSNLLYTLNLIAGEPEETAAEHRGWAAVHAPASLACASSPASVEETAGRRLRVGYVSADFCHHAVAYFFEPVLNHHDRKRFEIFCYSGVRAPDQVTAWLRQAAGADYWRETGAWSDETLDRRIREDRIDVLIDLSGHTAGNRLRVFARRPAAVQMTWLGYPNTTGLGQIDWRITDALTDPEGVTDPWHSEKLLRLPGPFSCYQAPAASPDPEPPARSGPPVFGCFNHLAKVADPVVALWSELLASAPGSRLLLKARGLADAATRADLRSRFAACGLAGDRLDLVGGECSVAEHLAYYRRVDVALDPFPYNGATTTCEALQMGVPVVTLAGTSHAARVGVCMLTHAGFPEGIASNPDEYVAAARRLASLGREVGERSRRRARFAASALCDASRFTRTLEEALSGAMRKKMPVLLPAI